MIILLQLPNWLIFLLMNVLALLVFKILQALFRLIIRFMGYKWFYGHVYLYMPSWRFARWLKYLFYGKKCERCRTNLHLTLHHKTYAHKWWEWCHLNDLQILCWTDHQIAQRKMKGN